MMGEHNHLGRRMGIVEFGLDLHCVGGSKLLD